MGTISEQLKLINTQLGYAKDSINNKYSIMDMPSIPDLKVKEISTRIDDIPVLNTKDANITPNDMIKDKIGYAKHEKVIGTMNNLSSNTIDLNITNINNLEFNIKDTDGYINQNTRFKLDKTFLANQLNIKPNIIKKGETILGIIGEYSGLEETGEADATSDDIALPKTAYVNQKKITGTLKDFRDENKNPLFSVNLDGNQIRINVEQGIYNAHSKIRIDLKQIANLINLSPDIIKNGEKVLGVTGTYVKPHTPEIEVDPDVNPDINIDEDYCDMDLRTNMFCAEFKWGWWELLNQQGTVANANEKIKLYIRMYNCYFYNGKYKGYYINNDKDTIYTSTYQHPQLGYSLVCQLEDLNLTLDEVDEVYDKITYDCPELLKKFSEYYYVNNSSNKIKHVFLANFNENTIKEYKKTCSNTFNEICNIVKSTYGISYTGGSNWADSVDIAKYSPREKAKIAKVIHDFLVLNNIYGHTDIKFLDQIMYPALSKGKYTPVCASYAQAFMWCCHKFGIWALPVVGWAGERHMWNMVCYEKWANGVVNALNNPSVWNEVDVTWDDPSTVTKCKWTYFNVTTAFLKTPSGGSRVRAKLGVTNYNTEAYFDYISECACKDYVYNGNTQYGGM